MSRVIHACSAEAAISLEATKSTFSNGVALAQLPEQRPLQDKVALVTGSSSGIGKAIATALGVAGAKLAPVSRRSQPTFDNSLFSQPSTIKWYSCDLANEAFLNTLCPKVLADFGGVDILVHAAGIFTKDPVEGSCDEFDQQLSVNLRAPYSLTKRLSASLRARLGQIVFINSSVARSARAGVSQYAATKSGLKAIADAFRDELNPHGVRVLSVFVGRTATPMQEAIFKQEGRQYVPERLLQPSDVASVVLNCLTLPRTAEVTEIDIRPMLKAIA